MELMASLPAELGIAGSARKVHTCVTLAGKIHFNVFARGRENARQQKDFSW